MTNNTINNVPRELLEVIEQTWRIHYQGSPVTTDIAADAIEKGLGQLRTLLSAPSPAGVDGLEVVALWYADDDLGRAVDYVKIADGEGLCRLSDAQAIIDGLRGEVADLRSMLATVSKAGLRVRTERDQHAQRIGELETALEFACKSLAQVTSSDGSGHADIAVSVLRMAGRKEIDASQIVEAYKAGAKWRIDAALSAGKEGE